MPSQDDRMDDLINKVSNETILDQLTKSIEGE